MEKDGNKTSSGEGKRVVAPKEISIDECIKLVHAIDSIGKYQVTQFTFSTEYGGYDMQQPPCAEISLRKTSSK